MTPFNVYIVGVGGQGVGLLAEALSFAVADAGFSVLCADTHGLAQRGGISSSCLRIGRRAVHPLIPPHSAGLVVALERLEALRAAREMMRPGGCLVYLDAVFHPASVRVGDASYPTPSEVERAVHEKNGTVHTVSLAGLEDPRMGNTLLTAALISLRVVPGLTVSRIDAAMVRALPHEVYLKNRELLLSRTAAAPLRRPSGRVTAEFEEPRCR